MVNTRISRTALILFLAAAGCTDSTVPDAALVQVYADVIMARQQYGDSAQVRTAVDSILQMHEMDAVAFDKELRAMSRTSQLFKAFYDSVSFELQRCKDTLTPR